MLQNFIYEELPEDTKQKCSCDNNPRQAVLKSISPTGKIIFLCREGCVKAFELIEKSELFLK